MLGLQVFNTLCSVNPVQGQNSCRIFDFWHENHYVELVNHSAVSYIFKASERLFSGDLYSLTNHFHRSKK